VSSFVDGGAEIGDESHFESLGKAGGAAKISQFQQNQSVQGSVGEYKYLFVFCSNRWLNLKTNLVYHVKFVGLHLFMVVLKLGMNYILNL